MYGVFMFIYSTENSNDFSYKNQQIPSWIYLIIDECNP